MPKYWGKQIFAHGRFPEVGQKQKTDKRKRKKERLNDGNNNGQATHGARKPPGPIVASIAYSMVRHHTSELRHSAGNKSCNCGLSPIL